MNNRKAKTLRARAGGYVHPQDRTYRRVHGRSLVCDRPEYRRCKAWKRLEKGVI